MLLIRHHDFCQFGKNSVLDNKKGSSESDTGIYPLSLSHSTLIFGVVIEQQRF